MPWLVTETVPWDGLVTAVVLFAVVFAVVSFAAVVGYVWECAQLRNSSIRKRGGVRLSQSRLTRPDSKLHRELDPTGAI